MVNEVNIQLPSGVKQFGLMGDKDDEPHETLAELESRLREEFQQTLADLQARHQADQQAWTATTQAIESAVEQLAEVREQLTEAYRHAAVELAMKIAEKVVMQELDQESFDIAPIVTEAVEQVPNRGQIEVRLNPADLRRCRLDQDETMQARQIRFIGDPSVSVGGCLVESREGCVESTVQDSLKQAEQALRDME